VINSFNVTSIRVDIVPARVIPIYILDMIELLVRILYPVYRRPMVMAQDFGYDWFPPTANGWGTMHPIPDIAPPLQTEEEGPPN
jgi:hypothetical protein